MIYNSRFIIPQHADPILQILHAKIEGTKDKGELEKEYHYLLTREIRIKQEDRATYDYVCKRFREKLGLEVAPVPSKPLASSRVEVKKIEEVPPLPKPPPLPLIDPSAYKIESCQASIESSKSFANKPGEEFIQKWVIKNRGELPLPAACKLKSYCSNSLVIDPKTTVCFEKEISSTDGEISISRAMRVPDAPGRYFDYFRIVLPTGQEIGPMLQCQIEVVIKPALQPKAEKVLTAKDFVQIDAKTWKADHWVIKKTKGWWKINENQIVQDTIPSFEFLNLRLVFAELPRSSFTKK